MMKRSDHITAIAIAILSLCVLISGCGGPQAATPAEGGPPAGEGEESEGPPTGEEERPEMEARPPEPGETLAWVDSSLLVYIPPGEFIMGHEGIDEIFPHPVYLDGYWIYRTEVTYSMYLNCMARGICSPPASDPSIPDIEDPSLADLPMVNLRWDQAAQYCEWMGGFLPTEAQWEKAARGLENFPFPWGEDNPTCDLLNFNDCQGETTAVNAYAQGVSPFGVYDMAGNVMEWVADWYDGAFYHQSPFDNPGGPQEGEERSVRGSTYASGPEMIPVFLRDSALPEEYSLDLGFRCVVANAQQFAPPCETLAYVPPEEGINTQEPPGGSASCVVPEPGISYTSYCHQGERRNNISWSPADADVTYAAHEGAWCMTYDKDTIICGGPPNSFVDVTACRSCPPPVVELGVPATCDKPYALNDATGLCEYEGPHVAGKELCAPGFSLNADRACCEVVDGTPLDFPVCAVGGSFDAASKVCWFLLPSTGDQKCDKERVNFTACAKDDGGGGRQGGGSAGSCSQYTIDDDCNNNGCSWDCYTVGNQEFCYCNP
jgi:formylglycine-generating enzyme required for sulfatase activity